jgi:hypothetical protein
MHFEVLIEDRSGKDFLEILLPKILTPNDTYNLHPYRGIGKLPAGLKTDTDPKKKMLLTQLPKLLQGYGNTFAGYPKNYRAAVICICDLDRRCRHDFRVELLTLLNQLNPRPETYFCIAEEEGEAWFLGDISAITAAYPAAKQSVLAAYNPDSICGTWETLADAVYPGGSKVLQTKAYFEIGAAKCDWARLITPHMEPSRNLSPSFNYFQNKVKTVLASKKPAHAG